MIVQETTVSEDNRAIGSGGKDTFFGIVDGMRQRVDVVSFPLYVGDVLYIPFQDDVAIFFFIPQVALLAHIIYLSFQQDAVFDVFL